MILFREVADLKIKIIGARIESTIFSGWRMAQDDQGLITVRLVLLGHAGVGKTAICRQFVEEKFTEGAYDPTVEDS